MRTKLILMAALGAALIAAGCGDDDDSNGDEDAASITKEEWIAQAGEICSTSDADIEAQAEEFFAKSKGGPEEEAELEFQTEVVLPAIEDQVSQVAALPVPEGDEDEIAAIVAAAEQGLEEAKADPSVIEGGGSLDEASRLISEYGVTECG